MKRLALVFVLVGSLARGDEPPPSWMPAAPPGPGRQEREQAKKLRHEAGLFTGIGIGLFAAGIAVNIVALDVPQAEVMTHENGNLVTRGVLGAANWAELAGGLTLMGTGFALIWLSFYKRKQVRRIEGSE